MNPVAVFFVAGGVLFLLVALFLRGLDNEGAQVAGLTFGVIGVCWIVPQLVIFLRQRDK